VLLLAAGRPPHADLLIGADQASLLQSAT
jgi:hypothetical protein